MAVTYNLFKAFSNTRGVDLRSSDLLRDKNSASDMLNCAFRRTGSLSKRLGFQYKTESAGGYGLSTFSNVDTETGQITEEVVCVDSTLRRYTENSITISYSGSASAYYDMYLVEDTVNGNQFYFDIYEDNVRVLNYALGTGVNETSPVTITNVVSQVNALTDFTCTGTSSSPAAFLELNKNVDITSGGITVNYYAWEEVNSPLASPFSTSQTNKDSAVFENATFANVNNVLYISTGYDDLRKYDGQNVYRAGMPRPDAPTTSLVNVGGGSINDTDIEHRLTYIQKDAKGNFVEGQISESPTALNPSNDDIDVVVDNIQASSGFNTGCAIVDGGQTTVNTLDVDDGSSGTHTLKVGDVAYFYDSVEGAYVERNITAITANTITIDGAAVTVSDNAVISNNLRIAIYRNTASGTTFSLVAEIPNNSFAATQTYTDTTAAASLGADYVEPIKLHGLPPKGKYISVFRNQLLVAGDNQNVNTVYYSDIDSPEYFPPGDNSFVVDTVEGDKVTGISPINNTFFIFKTRSIHALTGDLVTDRFRIDLISRGEVGCEAHHSIKEVDGRLFFLSIKGVYSVQSNAQAPVEESALIEPAFTAPGVTFNFKKAVAVNWLEQEIYALHMPVEAVDSSSEKVVTSSSRIYAYDYYRNSWLIWNTLDYSGGVTVANSELFFTERRLGSLSGDRESYTAKIKETGETQDYADHSEAIVFTYKSHWETLDEPSVFKKFLRMKIHSLDVSLNLLESDDFSLQVETEQDFIPNTVSLFNLDFSGGREGGWGVAPWGQFPWGMARIPKLKNKLRSSKAQSFRTIFKNSNVLENVLISGYELEVAAPYRLMIKE